MEKLGKLTPWQEKMAREVFSRATAAGDPDPLGAVAQLMAESRMNPNAVSKVGATGLAQFMPATAARFGLKNSRDPIASIDAAIKYRGYIRDYNAKRGVKGEDYVWAGYNAGEGAAVKARHGYRETRGYVSRIQAYKPQLAAMLALPVNASADSSIPPGYEGGGMRPVNASADSSIPPGYEGGGSGLIYGSSSGGAIPRAPQVGVATKFDAPGRPQGFSPLSQTPLSDAVHGMWQQYLSELSGDPSR